MDNNFKKNELILAIIASSFFLSYGITPFILNVLGIYDIDGSYENLIFSVVAAFFPILLYLIFKKSVYGKLVVNIEINELYILIIFIISSIVLYFFSWHDDRESFGSSLAAIFRGSWLVLMAQSYGQRPAKIFRLILMTVILMLIDQSRTAFGLALFVLALSYSIKILPFLILLITASAAWRMGASSGVVNDILYGLVGEGYNGAKGSLQAIAVKSYEINYLSHIFELLLQPVLTIFQFILQKISMADLDVTRHIGNLINQNLDEVYSPMGGFYISSEFIYYGYSGLVLLFFYLLITYLITKKIFDNVRFPVGSLLFIISIKATPFVYWKYIIYLYFIQETLRLISRLSVK